MKSLRNAFAAAAVLAGMGLGVGQAQPVEGGADPSTIQGQTQMQNDQYQQQAEQRQQADQQMQDQQQRQQDQQQQQEYGSQRGYDQGAGQRAASFGAIFVGAADPSVIRFSYNFASRA